MRDLPRFTVCQVNTTPAPDSDPLALGRRIIDILESGRKTSTYKLAVLQALIDCCMERVPDDQHACVDVPLDELTDKVIELYWPQTRPFPWNGNRPLRQASEGSEILNAIFEFRKASNASLNKLLADAKRQAPDGAYDKAFKQVRRTLVRYPLRLLQNVPGSTDAFLYEDDWIRDNPTWETIDKSGNVIQLREGVAYAMAKLSGLLKPALKWLWADKVSKSNPQFFHGPDVQQILFEDRIPLTRIRPALIKKFGLKCFYCNATAPDVTVYHVDHVLPLSVTKMNGLANLVLACQPCNSSKSDHIPVLEHVERALGMSTQAGTPTREEAVLNEIGEAIKWDAQFDRVMRAARGLYRTIGPGAPTWRAVGLPLEPLPSQLPAWITDADSIIEQAQ